MLFLILAVSATAQPLDHARRIRDVLSKEIRVCDSIQAPDTVGLRESAPHPLNGLVRQVLIERLAEKPGLVVVEGSAPCRTILEYQITGLSITAKAIGGLSFLGKKHVVRSVDYDIRFNLLRDARIAWTAAGSGTQSDTLSHAEFQSCASSAYPDLTPPIPSPAGSTLVDALIVLGAAGCLLYFLFL